MIDNRARVITSIQFTLHLIKRLDGIVKKELLRYIIADH